MNPFQPFLTFIGHGFGFAASSVAANAAIDWKESCAKCQREAGNDDTKRGLKLGTRDLLDAAVQAGFAEGQASKARTVGVKENDRKPSLKPTEGLSATDMQAREGHLRAGKN